MADHDEQVIVGEVAAHRIFDPVAAGVGSEQDDLEKPSFAEPLGGTVRDGVVEAFAQGVDHELELVTLAGREVVKTLLHGRGFACR